MSRALASLLVLASLLLSVGCDDDARFPPRRRGDFAHDEDATLRMNHVQMLATHNSYHVLDSQPAVVDWDYFFAPLGTQLREQGVRGLELDIYYTASEDEAPHYRVYHLPLVDPGSSCGLFDDCLAEIRRFSDAHPGHHPLFVQIELKRGVPEAEQNADLDLLDAQIRAIFPEELLITPDFVRGSHATLREAILDEGWPTLAAARGRTMFAFDCDRALCLRYLNAGTLDGRVLFVDSEPEDDFAAVMIANSPNATARSLVEQGFIVRVFADGAKDVLTGQGNQLEAALESGAQVISTDFPTPRVGVDYIASIPGGTPSRCSPVAAPEGCLASDVEDPSLLRGR